MTKLDDKTTIPLIGVIVALPTLVGFILWLASINSKADSALELGRSVKQEAKDDRAVIHEVRDMMIEIKAELKKQRR